MNILLRKKNLCFLTFRLVFIPRPFFFLFSTINLKQYCDTLYKESDIDVEILLNK